MDSHQNIEDKLRKNQKNNYKISENDSVNSTLDISNTIEIDINQEDNFELTSITSKKIGKCRIFCHYKGNALIVIGPDCKFKLI